MSNLQLVTTADGSKTIYNPEVGENYHSRHGALQESQHVFLNAGLRYYLAGTEATKVSILEVGFGTGLNFLLSADFCTGTEIKLRYTGIEAYPLTEAMIGQTGYEAYISPALWQSFLQQYQQALQQPLQLNTCNNLYIAHTPLLDFNDDCLYDVIYFDAFASIHQPEMWNAQAITHTLQFLKPGGVFVTYAITGDLKRLIKSLGLKVEKAPGAPGKREMLRAVKPL
ncbi:tRNA (5-methylaminomethyl-2-thiouridine)(34)-methyltransferase MnmD [Mucilaginibacter koreensis]